MEKKLRKKIHDLAQMHNSGRSTSGAGIHKRVFSLDVSCFTEAGIEVGNIKYDRFLAL